MDRMPSAQEWDAFSLSCEKEYDLESERERWNAKAPGFTHKRQRTGYLDQMLDLLKLQEGESVLDFGCGPGGLTVPIAQAGHKVIAADFSDGMIAELKSTVDKAGVGERVQIIKRAWQEPWDDIPCCDVALSSRSLTSANIADAIAKLESKARRRVVISTAAGESPWNDIRVWQAIGREVDYAKLSQQFIILINYLFAIGRLPRIEYIESERPHESNSESELRAFLHDASRPKDETEEAKLKEFLDRHIVPRPGGGYQTDYAQPTRWAVITWDTPQ